MKRDWTPVRNGDIYCSPACGAGCTYEAFQKATKDAEELAKLCQEKIGGVWKARVHENLGWHWNVYQEETNISIYKYTYDNDEYSYAVGVGGGTPIQVSTHPNTFEKVEDAYAAQTAAIQQEADRWNVLLKAIHENSENLKNK